MITLLIIFLFPQWFLNDIIIVSPTFIRKLLINVFWDEGLAIHFNLISPFNCNFIVFDFWLNEDWSLLNHHRYKKLELNPKKRNSSNEKDKLIQTFLWDIEKKRFTDQMVKSKLIFLKSYALETHDQRRFPCHFRFCSV